MCYDFYHVMLCISADYAIVIRLLHASIFHTPLRSMTPLVGPCRNTAIPSGLYKLEYCG